MDITFTQEIKRTPTLLCNPLKRIFLTSILVICSLFPLVAQNNIRITGTVLDKTDNDPIEQAGIRILRQQDSTYVAGVATDDAGKFLINAKPGKYIVNVTYLGYKEAFVDVDATKKSVVMEPIFLSGDAILLNEAVVTAKAAEIAIKGDTVEHNADSYKVQPSAVVEDLLKKMPGAEVDDEGKITINGKEIKKILVDGKEFFSTDPKVASKNLPAAMIDKLQVLDRKSDLAQMSGFDDGDEETVINLTVKKGMKQGIFGNASAGAGSHDRYGANAIVNYMRNDNQFTFVGGSNNTNNAGFTDNASNSFRRSDGMSFGGRNGITKASNGGLNFAITSSKELKWGGNIRFGDTNNNVESKTYRERYAKTDSKGSQYTNTMRNGNNKGTNFGADFRFEWTPDSLTKIIFSPTMQSGKNTNTQASNQLTTYINPSDTINWGNARSSSDGTTNSISGRLDISRELGKKGRRLLISLSGGLSNQDSDGANWSITTYRKAAGDSVALRDQIYDQKNRGNNWRANISYVEPIGNNNFLQLKYTYRKNHSESDRNTYLNDGNDEYSVIDGANTKNLENNFVNQEISVSFKSVRPRYNYTVGAALQPSSSKSLTTTPIREPSLVDNKVLNFAPEVQFNYLWDKRHNLRIDYEGRTTQPTTTQLSDVRDESNPNNISYGNPNLKPAFTHRLRLRLQKFNPEQSSALMVFGGLRFSTNDIVNKSKQFNDGRTERTYANINGNWDSDLRVIFNRPLRNKKFSISSMSFGSYGVNNSFVNEDKNTTNSLTLAENIGIQYRSELFDFGLRGNVRYSNIKNNLNASSNRNIYNYGGSFNSTWYLPFNITVSSDVNYTANSGMTDGYDSNQWLWNASISKQLFKAKNGTLRFDMYDILNQNTNISFSQSSNNLTQSMTNTLGSYFMFSFIYKFQIFKGGAKMSDVKQEERGPRMGPRGGGDRRPGSF